MPRQRSRDKVVPVSIGLPISLMMRLDSELNWNQSRSKYVKSAILQKLENQFDFGSVPSKQLLGMILNRGIIEYEMYLILVKRAEEIEEQQ